MGGKSAICDIGWLKTNTKTCTNTSVKTHTHTHTHVHTCSKGMSACALAALAFGFHSIFITSSAYLRKVLHLLLLLLIIIILLRTFFCFLLCQLTKLVDELVPLRLPKVTGGAPEALQMPGGQVRKFVKFLHAKESQENRSLSSLSVSISLAISGLFCLCSCFSVSARKATEQLILGNNGEAQLRPSPTRNGRATVRERGTCVRLRQQ